MLQLADLLEGLYRGYCLNCLRPHMKEAGYGPLVVRGRPAQVHWHGLKRPEFTVTEARLLGVLVQFREVAHDALMVVLPGNGGDNCLKVHIRNIRRKLSAMAGDEVQILQIRGHGYAINVRSINRKEEEVTEC